MYPPTPLCRNVTPRELAKLLEGKDQTEIQQAPSLLADAKSNVNQYVAAGKKRDRFRRYPRGSPDPLELAISKPGAWTQSNRTVICASFMRTAGKGGLPRTGRVRCLNLTHSNHNFSASDEGPSIST